MHKIGVFDSGVGGLSVARAIQRQFPHHQVVFMNDAKHVPYGNKTASEMKRYAKPILQKMVDQGCRIIVIACNSVTTTLINDLRKEINVPLIGVEPMIKPAANLSQTGIITVCATPATLASKRYTWLKNKYAKDVRVLEPDCSDWAFMIENDSLDRHKIFTMIDDTCKQGADVIVIGCTHYHWIEDLIKETANGRAKVLQPEDPVITQLTQALELLA